jgi:hypothetical protein
VCCLAIGRVEIVRLLGEDPQIADQLRALAG